MSLLGSPALAGLLMAANVHWPGTMMMAGNAIDSTEDEIGRMAEEGVEEAVRYNTRNQVDR